MMLEPEADLAFVQKGPSSLNGEEGGTVSESRPGPATDPGAWRPGPISKHTLNYP